VLESIPIEFPPSQHVPQLTPAQLITINPLPPGVPNAVSQSIDCGVMVQLFTAVRVIIRLHAGAHNASQGIVNVDPNPIVVEPPLPHGLAGLEQSSNCQEISIDCWHPRLFVNTSGH
jgi:hypothetical protein